jgi:hypothetical protein
VRTLSRITSLLLLSGLLIVPTVEAATRVYVRIGPPPIVVERVIAAPAPGYVWQSGYHRWDGDRYVWVRGSWAQRPWRHAHWVPSHWVRTYRGYYFVPGHWSRRYYY